MTKNDIDQMRTQFVKYATQFTGFRSQLTKLTEKLTATLSFDQYAVSVKPEADKLLYSLMQLDAKCSKITEDKTILKHLKKEFDAMKAAREGAAQAKNVFEQKIPKR